MIVAPGEGPIQHGPEEPNGSFQPAGIASPSPPFCRFPRRLIFCLAACRFDGRFSATWLFLLFGLVILDWRGFLPEGFFSPNFSRLAISFPRKLFAARQFFRGKHCAAALLRSTGARALVIVAIVKAIVVAKLFSRSNVPDRRDPNAPVNLLSLAVRVAGVVDEHGGSVSIDDLRAVPNGKQIGDRFIFVAKVGLVLIDQGPGIFHDARAFCDGRGGIAASSMNRRGTDDKAHSGVGTELMEYSSLDTSSSATLLITTKW